jgi:ABC-type nickel/cobalt efflux system permease component RcnA
LPGFLARLLHQGDLGWGLLLAGVAVAFALGAIHALSPGHGKTIVVAYLVGTRGTPMHAVLLGGVVTFTHTVTVFFLGFATLFLSQYVLPERIYPVLGVISGISIVGIGAVLLYKRAQPHHHHHHDRSEVGMAGLVALGASGGLVPCPTALVLLLSAVSLGRTGLGLILLVAFSAGLAVVLTAIGLAVLYAKHWLPDGEKTASHAVFRYLPVVSAAVIVCIGVTMTWVALRQR